MATVKSLAFVAPLPEPLDPSMCELDFVCSLVQGILSTSEAQTMEILKLRHNMVGTEQSECVDLFMAMDVEIGHLDKNDTEEFKTEKQKASEKSQVSKSFTKAWVARKIKHGGKKSCLEVQKKLKTNKYPPLPLDNPTHREAKAWLPPDSVSIWRGLSDGGWHCRY